mgnify:FL=1|jgi:hypothetical protein
MLIRFFDAFTDPNKAAGVYTSSFVFIQKVSIGITIF